MELLEDIRFYNHTGKIPTQVIREAVLHNGLFDNVLEEGQENTPERVGVLNKINNDTYIKNNYKAFLEELKRNKRAEFLTPYTVQDFINAKVQTFQVPGYEIGFALKPMANGDMYIISVHNNTNIGGVGEALIDSAIRLGGTTLDHFDGYLSDFYQKKGFEEKERMKWNDAYAPKNWNYKKYGTPDIVLRRLGGNR
jgi:hypothetical protein